MGPGTRLNHLIAGVSIRADSSCHISDEVAWRKARRNGSSRAASSVLSSLLALPTPHSARGVSSSRSFVKRRRSEAGTRRESDPNSSLLLPFFSLHVLGRLGPDRVLLPIYRFRIGGADPRRFALARA
ncbi:hypothetical protein B296_00021745 [Ensete ventricosum]|uniref:Uncharacterized protein n=1 Tax=Ensete ventricosum TaxID=4639 RepID=A0A426ZBC9_ENSVE|nr:hypothetical protein B296_00021745 [Ensete ventricosum]